MKLPQHLAIIMDGNGRWAKQRLKPRYFGHVKGTRVAKDIIHECSKMGLKNLTLYAFSNENWNRPTIEVQFLMKILKRYLEKETQNLIRENIRFSVLGETDRLPKNVQEQLSRSIQLTSKCTGLHLVFALSYGSRQEITEAMKKIASKVAAGEITPSEITERTIQHHLGTSEMPDPDFIIRTSGEQRISNFLLWQSAYSELYFSQLLWPDFKISDLHLAMMEFGRRERRFGKTEAATDLHHALY